MPSSAPETVRMCGVPSWVPDGGGGGWLVCARAVAAPARNAVIARKAALAIPWCIVRQRSRHLKVASAEIGGGRRMPEMAAPADGDQQGEDDTQHAVERGGTLKTDTLVLLARQLNTNSKTVNPEPTHAHQPSA